MGGGGGGWRVANPHALISNHGYNHIFLSNLIFICIVFHHYFFRFLQVYVYFVDYGDTEVIEERENIQPLQEDFLQLPFQGVQGSLVGEFE